MRVYVSGMSCQHCKIAVEKAFSAIEGVDSVNVNLEGAYADVVLNSKVDDEKFIDALADTAYEVVKIEK
ncbi:heavy-metal-associated domain-containing protein [Desulfurella multipotens]|uniref:heavy-metal-associated domain-containing protein n=1 Tax=Desulfurella TaxID=33001 RepID=UPI000CBC0B27|nr:cation transporter [Desulfurella multipotens]PMP63941.1 MAG: heavy metal transport/detoxification protein [Desulfurella multipotens]